jgi:hypothetical protein
VRARLRLQVDLGVPVTAADGQENDAAEKHSVGRHMQLLTCEW